MWSNLFDMKKIIKVDNKEYTATEVRVDIEDLTFNPYNARIFSISKKILDDIREEENLDENAEVDIEKLTTQEVQDRIFEGFQKKYLKDSEYKSLRKSIIRTKGLSEEKIIYITNKNLVLSGNTRLSILKTLKDEGAKDINFTVKAFRIQENIDTQEEIDVLENFFQYNLEEKVNYENFELWMKMHQLYRGGEKYNFNDIAKKYNMDESQVEKHIYTINEYYKTLRKLGNKDYISLYKEMSVSSVVQYISGDLNGDGKKTKKHTKEIRSAVTELAIDSFLVDFNWNKIRKVINTYLKVKNKDFDNEKKIEAINNLRDEMLEASGDVKECALELIREHKPIKENKELREKMSHYDASNVISEMQTEANKIYADLDKNSEQQIKYELDNIKKSIRKITLLSEDNKTIEKLKELLNEIEKTIYN